jgi:colanic acid/amylovoran biosynthesis glycosyltransferase
VRSSPPVPLRVLVLATTFPAESGDGTPEFVLTLSAELAKQGVAVTVLAPRTPGAVRAEIIDGVRVRRFRYFPRRWERLADGAIMANLRAQPWQLLQVIPLMIAFQVAALVAVIRERPHVVHAHWIVPAGLVARVVCLLTGTPYVVTAHGADAYTLSGPVARAMKRSVLRSARATVPVSADVGRRLADIGRVGPPVPMGVDAARIRSEVGPRSPEPGVILFIGRLVEKKGADVLLEAAATLPDASVVIAGGGPQGPALARTAARLGIAERVRFLGSVPRREVMRQLRRASVVAVPSRVGAGGDQDGVPVVLAEAIAAGVPTVVTALGGLGEYMADGRTGRVVAPGAVPELAAALTDLLADPDTARRYARTAAARVLPELTVERTADAYLEILASAPDGSGAARPA